MMHPDTEVRFINEVKGYGVVATQLIPEGTITWIQDDLDQVYTTGDIEKMHPKSREMMDKYAFRNRYGKYVLCWDLAKYVNHSFNSNCLSTAYGFEIAVRDIQPGEELTDDYGYLNLTEPFEADSEGTSRNAVYPDDLLNYHKNWDEKLQKSILKFGQVYQPLVELIPEEIQRDLEKVISREKTLDSILNLYCP
ncbi:SET domain-containing protein [Salegentibacter sp. HM20]